MIKEPCEHCGCDREVHRFMPIDFRYMMTVVWLPGKACKWKELCGCPGYAGARVGEGIEYSHE